MLYAIMSKDVPDSAEFRAAGRARHIARLEALRDAGRLVVAGPHPAIDTTEPGPAGFTGSLVIAEFDNLEEATDWARNDPYFEAGAYESFVVKPFKLVLP